MPSLICCIGMFAILAYQTSAYDWTAKEAGTYDITGTFIAKPDSLTVTQKLAFKETTSMADQVY